MFLLPSASTFGPAIDRLYLSIFWICGVVFIAVQAALVWFCLRYWHRWHPRATFRHSHRPLEIAWTAIPATILIGLGFVSQNLWPKLQAPEGAATVHVRVLAQQWLWQFTYPGPDGVFGTSDDITTQNELHVPLGETVAFELTSMDVIHGFYIPALRIHRDAVPGLKMSLAVHPTRVGRFEIRCSQFCGTDHYQMGGTLVVDMPDDYQQWLKRTREAVF